MLPILTNHRKFISDQLLYTKQQFRKRLITLEANSDSEIRKSHGIDYA